MSSNLIWYRAEEVVVWYVLYGNNCAVLNGAHEFQNSSEWQSVTSIPRDFFFLAGCPFDWRKSKRLRSRDGLIIYIEHGW